MKHHNEDVALSLLIRPRKIISGANPDSPAAFSIRPDETAAYLFLKPVFDFASILTKVPRDGRVKMEADADEGETMRFGFRRQDNAKQTSAKRLISISQIRGGARAGADGKQENTLIVNTVDDAACRQ